MTLIRQGLLTGGPRSTGASYTDAQIHDTTAAFYRYLRTVESGSVPDAMCAPRVEELPHADKN